MKDFYHENTCESSINVLEFGLRVRQERKNAGLSVSDICQKLLVSEKTVYRWEAGATLPSLQNLLALSLLLHTSIDYLLKGK